MSSVGHPIGYAYGADPLDVDAQCARQETVEWRLFWILAVPQILLSGAVLAAGVPGLLLPVACLPLLIASVVNPFLGIATLFSVVVFDDMLAVYGTSFTLSKTIAVFVFIGFLIRGRGAGYNLFPVEPISIAGTCLVCLMVISSAWSLFPIKSLASALTPVLLCGLTIIGSQVVDRRHRIDIVLAGMMLSGAVAGALLALDVGGVTTLVGGDERASLGGANSNQTGRILVVSSVATLGFLFYGKHRILKPLAPVALFLMLIAILRTKSRGALIEYGVSNTFAVLLGLRARMGQKLALLIVAGCMAVGSFMAGGLLGMIDTETVFSRWRGGVEGLTHSRANIHEVGIELWASSVKNMAIGAGYATFSLAYTEQAGRSQELRSGVGRDAHNQWVKTLGELGVVGIAFLLFLVGALIYVTIRTAPGFAVVSWGIVGMFIVASMSASLDYVKISWYSLMLVGAIGRCLPKIRSSRSSDPILAEYYAISGASA